MLVKLQKSKIFKSYTTRSSLPLPYVKMLLLADGQEVKKLTDSLVKDSKKFEKEQVALSEKKKHLVTKQKKFKKSITDVRNHSRRS